MNKFDEIKNEIDNINTKINTHKEKYIEPLNQELFKLRKELQKVCPHENITHKPSETFYEYCERPQHFYASIKCNDCGLWVSEDNDEYRNPKIREIFNRYNS